MYYFLASWQSLSYINVLLAASLRMPPSLLRLSMMRIYLLPFEDHVGRIVSCQGVLGMSHHSHCPYSYQNVQHRDCQLALHQYLLRIIHRQPVDRFAHLKISLVFSGSITQRSSLPMTRKSTFVYKIYPKAHHFLHLRQMTFHFIPIQMRARSDWGSGFGIVAFRNREKASTDW